jgi:hypothetical protein
MEKLYKKIGKRYVECGYNYPDISDGIWLVQSKPGSKSQQSLLWKVGDIKRPVDVVTHAALQSIEDDLANYLMRLCDETSSEFKEAKEYAGSWLLNPIKFYNISASLLVTLLLRKLSTHLEEGINLSWDDFHFKFREEIGLEKIERMSPIETLYAFTKWLKDNNVKFRQNKNIG